MQVFDILSIQWSIIIKIPLKLHLCIQRCSFKGILKLVFKYIDKAWKISAVYEKCCKKTCFTSCVASKGSDQSACPLSLLCLGGFSGPKAFHSKNCDGSCHTEKTFGLLLRSPTIDFLVMCLVYDPETRKCLWKCLWRCASSSQGSLSVCWKSSLLTFGIISGP